MLREITKMEQRYDAVLAVIRDGISVKDIAEKFGVSRQSVHAWLARYEAEGLVGLEERSHRPKTSPLQMPAPVEARALELRDAHPSWGPVRLRYQLEREGWRPHLRTRGSTAPSCATIASSPRRHASACPPTSVGNGAARWSCGRWTSSAGSS